MIDITKTVCEELEFGDPFTTWLCAVYRVSTIVSISTEWFMLAHAELPLKT